MLTLGIKNGARLYFKWPDAEVRLLCIHWAHGEMLLWRPSPTIPWAYKPLALLRNSEFREIWPGVRLKYSQDRKDRKGGGRWGRIEFDMPDTVKVGLKRPA